MFELISSIFDFLKTLLECCILCSDHAPPQESDQSNSTTISVPDGASCHIEVDVCPTLPTSDEEEKRIRRPSSKKKAGGRPRKRSRSIKKTTTTTTTEQVVETTEIIEGSGTPSPGTTGGVFEMSKTTEKTTL